MRRCSSVIPGGGWFVERAEGGGAHDGPAPVPVEGAVGFAVEVEDGVAGRDDGVSAVSFIQHLIPARTVTIQHLGFIASSCLRELVQSRVSPRKDLCFPSGGALGGF